MCISGHLTILICATFNFYFLFDLSLLFFCFVFFKSNNTHHVNKMSNRWQIKLLKWENKNNLLQFLFERYLNIYNNLNGRSLTHKHMHKYTHTHTHTTTHTPNHLWAVQPKKQSIQRKWAKLNFSYHVTLWGSRRIFVYIIPYIYLYFTHFFFRLLFFLLIISFLFLKYFSLSKVLYFQKNLICYFQFNFNCCYGYCSCCFYLFLL